MPRYLVQVSYTPEAWAALIKRPHNRLEAIGDMLRSLGGRWDVAYFAFGEYDVVGIAEFPDNVSAAAQSMLVSAGGSVKAVKTTPLMTIDEGIEAMRKGGAAAASYRPPTA